MQSKPLIELICKELFFHEQDSVFKELESRLGIMDKDVYEAYEYYDSDVYGYDNDVYSSIPIRFVQYLHARKYGSWHVAKNRTISAWLADYWPCKVVDVGYGIPQSYLLDRIPFPNNGSFALLEKYKSAKLFGEQLINIYDEKSQSNIAFHEFDMDQDKISHYGNADVHLFLDSLEHATDPEKLLESTRSAAHNKSVIFLSLPIGEIVPVHSISWSSANEIIAWVTRNGLDVQRTKELAPNPKVDIFIESMHSSFSTLLLECSCR
ncbi:hypothetical protein [Candidatus Thiosymbion oneisti]|uniref:hypothetical protein n=1 Tax=Candidatus Thiosymbion oneisti TaxID=589554 RepID=UPI00114C8D2C|nr:hypothetical protein [Candidatus Thiosymbion oneisti]